MFTGIVQEIGTVVKRQASRGVVRLTIQAPKTAARVRPLESVAVNGACLSVVAVARGALAFEMIPETQRLTTLGALRIGDPVNLEPSLSLTDRLNGHVVLGHVDGVGRVIKRQQRRGELVLTIRVAPPLRRLLVPKGPVTVDGVSLTVGQRLTASSCAVHLIPETLRRTTLRCREVGDVVNIELDYLAKLVAQVLVSRR
ncbi:MAG: riboflavin synthase [Candidatus Omnitrophica bacterium]|nr:riboflavin synthase [Candidatus Omnitrophota bacterium]